MDAFPALSHRKDTQNPIYDMGKEGDTIHLEHTNSLYKAWSNTQKSPFNPAYNPISIQESSTDVTSGLIITKTTREQGNNHLAFCCHDCNQGFKFSLSESVSVDLRPREETYETPAASMNTPLEMATGLLKLPHLNDSVRSLLLAYTNNPSSMNASLVEKSFSQQELSNYEDINLRLFKQNADSTYDNAESGFGEDEPLSKSSSENSDSPQTGQLPLYDLRTTAEDLYDVAQPLPLSASPRKSEGYLHIGPDSDTDQYAFASDEQIEGFRDPQLYDTATDSSLYATLPSQSQPKVIGAPIYALGASDDTYATIDLNLASKQPKASTDNLYTLASDTSVQDVQGSALYDAALDPSSQLYGTLPPQSHSGPPIYALGSSQEQETYAVAALPTQQKESSKEIADSRSIIIFPCGHIRHGCQETNHTGCNCNQSTPDFAGKALLLTLPPEKQIEQVTTIHPRSSRKAKLIALGLLGVAAAGAGIAFAFSSSSSSSSQASSEGPASSTANCTNELAELAYQNMSLAARNLSYVPLQNVVLAALNASACNTMATVVGNTLDFANMSHVAGSCYTSLLSRLSPLKSYLPTAASVDLVRDNLIAAQNDTACKPPASTSTPTQPSISSSTSTQKPTTPTLQPSTQPGPTSTPVTTFFTQLSTAMSTASSSPISTLSPSTTNGVTTFFSTLAEATTHVDTTTGSPTTLLTTFLTTLAQTISSTQTTSTPDPTTTILSTFLTSLSTSMSTSDTTPLTTLLTTLATTTPAPTTPTTILTTFLTTLATTSTLATTASPSTTTMLTTLLTSLATTITSTTAATTPTPSPTSTSTTQLTTLLTTLATTVTTLSTTTPPPSPTTILTTLMTTLATTTTQSSSSTSKSTSTTKPTTTTTNGDCGFLGC